MGDPLVPRSVVVAGGDESGRLPTASRFFRPELAAFEEYAAPDPVEAAGWYMSARRAGLVDPEMDDFLEGLTDAQLADAAKRADAHP